MKSLIHFSIVFILLNLFLSYKLLSQSCGFDEEEQVELTQTGGYRITSEGTVKALLIFIDFSDDDVDPTNSTWPVGAGPNYLDQIIDLTEGQNSGIIPNVTTFFRNMSFDRFTMIGKAYYVQAPQTLSWYIANHPGQEAAYSARDAIQILDQTVDFLDYDRWKWNGPYLHEEGQDGKLDMVFICFRRWYICPEPPTLFCSSFLAEGWYGGSFPGGSVSIDGGQRQIISAQSVNVLRMMQYPRLEHLLHEFGHVWGLPHNYSGGLWTLMGHRHPNISSFMNSYERERLGWIYFTEVTQDGYNATIADFGEHGVAYRIQIPNTNEAFLFENHQGVRTNSPYDVVDWSAPSGTKGLYILQQRGSELRVVAADGRWNWSNPYWIQNPWSTNPLDSIPVYNRESMNRYIGYTKKVAIPHSKGGSGYMHAWLDEVTGVLQTAPRYKGDGKDRFTFSNNNVFSPWSAYAAYRWNGSSATTIGSEITGGSGANINVKFYTQNPQNAPPSKPTDVKVSINGNLNPVVSWNPNIEPDMPGGQYKVWRTVTTGGEPTSYSHVGTVNIPGSGSKGPATYSWIDQSVLYCGGGNQKLFYTVSAIDNTSKESVLADPYWLPYNNTVSCKENAKIFPEETKISEYKLYNNYPNPFNPQTIIQYDVKEAGLVQLKVYDILGKEVALLINENKDQGKHFVTFDAENLPSGIYIYSIRVNDYLSTQKMILLR